MSAGSGVMPDGWSSPTPASGGRSATPALTPFYSDDLTTIYHGDALDLMAGLPDESVDIVVTSPPYNMGLVPGGYGVHDDAMPQQEYDLWQRRALVEMWRITRHAVFYVHRPRVEHGRLRLPLGFDFDRLPLRQIIVWDRGTGIDVNLRNYCTRQEWVLLFAKPSFQLVDHAASGQGDVWRLGMAYDETEHPAPFPTSLPARCIATSGAQSVLDPFLGSGTTLVAAKNLGVKGVGIEIEERWCKRAALRCSQEVLGLQEASA